MENFTECMRNALLGRPFVKKTAQSSMNSAAQDVRSTSIITFPPKADHS